MKEVHYYVRRGKYPLVVNPKILFFCMREAVAKCIMLYTTVLQKMQKCSLYEVCYTNIGYKSSNLNKKE